MKTQEVKNSTLIRRSIAHWRRMIKWVKTQDPNGKPRTWAMFEAIGEKWLSLDCALCIEYYDGRCTGCPMNIIGYRCECDHSPWSIVDASPTWSEWLANSYLMLTALQYVLSVEVAKEGGKK